MSRLARWPRHRGVAKTRHVTAWPSRSCGTVSSWPPTRRGCRPARPSPGDAADRVDPGGFLSEKEQGGLGLVLINFGIPFDLVPLVLSAAGKHVMGAFAIGRLSVLGWARSTRCQGCHHARPRAVNGTLTLG
jgi:hypothetical protein